MELRRGLFRSPDLRDLVSKDVGIVTGLQRVLHTRSAATAPMVNCWLANTAGTLGDETNHPAGGIGRTDDEATCAALGEAVERYSASYRDPARERSLSDINLESVVRPSEFKWLSAAQRSTSSSYAPQMVKAVDLHADRPTWLPTSTVFLSGVDQRERFLIGDATSSGLAAWHSRPGARLRALLELLERDAFMLFWLTRAGGRAVQVSAGPSTRDKWEAAYRARAAEARLFDLTPLTIAPTILAVVRDPDGPIHLAVGASSKPTKTEAAQKALGEACQTYDWAQYLLATGEHQLGHTDPNLVRTFDDHVSWHLQDDNMPDSAFLFGDFPAGMIDECDDLPSGSESDQMLLLLERLAAMTVRVFAADVTAPDIADLGMHVERIVSPDLCPLNVDGRLRPLGNHRLHRLLGLNPGSEMEAAEIANPSPHPFP